MKPILTIAIPAYNMEWCLEKNLSTYFSPDLEDDLEVIILNNCSSDRTSEIAQRFCKKYPKIFKQFNRESRGYGSSINAALKVAQGTYFRVIDADDWVDTEELKRFLQYLQSCDTDIVQTDYTIVDMQTGARILRAAQTFGINYETLYTDFSCAIKTLPAIHSTTYRTNLLRDHGFYMQDNTFFVDEEYIVLPFLYAKNIIYYPCNVYQYQVANPEQSTSPRNRGKYAEHRERVIKRLIQQYQQAKQAGSAKAPFALEYCSTRIRAGVADHFTTLYIYVDDRKYGRTLANRWKESVYSWIDFRCRCKQIILYIFNMIRITPKKYEILKKRTTQFWSHIRCNIKIM